MKYVSPEYQARLEHLAETLCTPDRFAGQLALFETVELNVVPLFPVETVLPPAA